MASAFKMRASGDRGLPDGPVPVDLSQFCEWVIAKLDIVKEYADLGVRFDSTKPNGRGVVECHAIDRDDVKPSAFVNPTTGVYFDKGNGHKGESLFNFALKYGNKVGIPFGRITEVFRHYGKKTGIVLPAYENRSEGRVRETHYDYFDGQGELRYRVFRYLYPNGGKTFTQHPPDGRGGWKWQTGSMADVVPLPYHLPELMSGDTDEPIYIGEGEKVVHFLESHGFLATTHHGGHSAGDKHWEQIAKHQREVFADRDVFILPDNDDGGMKSAHAIARHLHGIGSRVFVVYLPDLPYKADVVDWFSMGGTVEEFGKIAHKAKLWQPGDPVPVVKDPSAKTPIGDTSAVELILPGDGPDWRTPKLYGLPEPMPFPVEALPPRLADHVQALAAGIGCPPDFPACAALVVASIAIGRSVSIAIKPDWIENPSLYMALIAMPGSAKSPALDPITAPLGKIGYEQIERFKEEISSWKSVKDNPNPKPVPTYVTLGNATVESLVQNLEDSPRGIGLLLDELTSLFSGMGQYKGGKGNDREFYLSAWAGRMEPISRKGNIDRMPIYVPNPFVSILGNITTKKLKTIVGPKSMEDGFPDRLLFSMPNAVKSYWNTFDTVTEFGYEWEQVVRKLWSYPLNIDRFGKTVPHRSTFSESTQAVFGRWVDSMEDEVWVDDSLSFLRGPWKKLKAYCARLALIIERLGSAYDPTWDGYPGQVSIESLQSAITLVEYFKSHAERVYLSNNDDFLSNEDATAIVKWVQRHERPKFSESDAHDRFRKRFPVNSPNLEPAIRWLIARHCIRPIESEPRKPGRVGRPPSPEYLVNPALLKGKDGE